MEHNDRNIQVQLEELEFAMKNIISVAERRKIPGIIENARKLLQHIQSLIQAQEVAPGSERVNSNLLSSLCADGLSLADSLIARTVIEIREVLFPLSEIKRDARKFGNEFFSDYFQWKDPGIVYSPESLMGILENDLHFLNTARDIIRKNQSLAG